MEQVKLGCRPESGSEGTKMPFNDIRAYPQLSPNEMRIDGNHADDVAVEEFSRLVAENFSQFRRENRIQ